jgi:ABC-type thiamin/hydroxymethylpyrimidine transport system permease subunit
MAVFGALWGLVEISLGSVLHAINIPLTGLALTCVGLAVAMIGRLFVPRRGSTIFIGVIATVLKLFSIGNIIIGPMIAILAEALIAEIILDLFPRPSRLAFMLTGAGGALWTLVQPFVTGLLLFGRSLLVVWLDLIDLGARIFHLDSNAAIWIAGLMTLLYLAVGAVAGWLAWQVGKLLVARLGGRFAPVQKSQQHDPKEKEIQ